MNTWTFVPHQLSIYRAFFIAWTLCIHISLFIQIFTISCWRYQARPQEYLPRPRRMKNLTNEHHDGLFHR